MAKSKELFYRDGLTRRDAALHATLLENAEADLRISVIAVERAIDAGIDPEMALDLYGYRK